MVSDNIPADQPSATLIPVQIHHVDQLVAIARDLAGFLLILDAAATGDPTLAAVERILNPINEQLQEFKTWFHHVWHLAIAGHSDTP
jgi:hypothetical protein